MTDRETRLRARIDALLDERDKLRDQLEKARAAAALHRRKKYEAQNKADLWRRRYERRAA